MEELNIERKSKTTKLLTDLYSEKRCIIDEIIVIEIKLEKLRIPKKKESMQFKINSCLNRRLKDEN